MSRIFGEISQLGHIVPDIEKAMDFWINVLGVGPFFYVKKMRAEQYRYRGKEYDIEFAAALANSGNLQIELLQPLCGAPSMWRDFLDAGKEGFQHVAFWTENYDEAMNEAERLGYSLVQDGVLGGGRFSYFDTAETGGLVVELSEFTGPKRQLFTAVREAAVGWDGSNPIRVV